jgi:carbonic anhydrase/acetyltransferase-like protein (isoleucine patch superfamily)
MAVYALGDLVPEIDEDAYVHPDATVIGAVTLGPFASVWPQAVLRGDSSTITVGERSNIQDGSVLHTAPSTPTVIGDRCVIGHNVHIEGATVGEGCLIASGSVVLNATVIEPGGVVGAGAVVSYRGHVRRGELALGVPAKCRENNSLPPEGIAAIVEGYVENAKRFRAGLRRLA